MQNTLHRETKRHYDKLLLSEILSFLGDKMLKRMNSTLYGETEQHYLKRVF